MRWTLAAALLLGSAFAQELQPGETMRFMNDHDPIPLLNQINGHFGDRVQINYVRRDPGEIVIDFVVVG